MYFVLQCIFWIVNTATGHLGHVGCIVYYIVYFESYIIHLYILDVWVVLCIAMYIFNRIYYSATFPCKKRYVGCIVNTLLVHGMGYWEGIMGESMKVFRQFWYIFPQSLCMSIKYIHTRYHVYALFLFLVDICSHLQEETFYVDVLKDICSYLWVRGSVYIYKQISCVSGRNFIC